jgi:hypothetical protein
VKNEDEKTQLWKEVSAKEWRKTGKILRVTQLEVCVVKQSLISQFIELLFANLFCISFIPLKMTRVRFPEKLWKLLLDERLQVSPCIQWNEGGTCFKIIDEIELLCALTDAKLKCNSFHLSPFLC